MALEGHALALAGDRAAALTIARQLEAASSQQYVSSVDIAIVYCGLGDRDSGIKWLANAFERRDRGIDMLRAEPLFDGCRDDARVSSLLRRLNLLP